MVYFCPKLNEMLSSARIKSIRLLHQKKYRNEQKLFLAEGVKVVEELLKSSFVTREIFALPQWLDSNQKSIPAKTHSEAISEKELERISALSTPNMVVAIVEKPEFQFPDLKSFDGFILMLDGISDPGNLGTIIRTADWFGIHTIICSSNSVDAFNPKVVQSAMGSVFRVSLFYLDLIEVLTAFKDTLPVYGTFLSGENLYKTSFGTKGIVVIGSESHGISTELSSFIKSRITIPAVSNSAESLNASIAAALVCAEVNRKSLINI